MGVTDAARRDAPCRRCSVSGERKPSISVSSSRRGDAPGGGTNAGSIQIVFKGRDVTPQSLLSAKTQEPALPQRKLSSSGRDVASTVRVCVRVDRACRGLRRARCIALCFACSDGGGCAPRCVACVRLPVPLASWSLRCALRCACPVLCSPLSGFVSC